MNTSDAQVVVPQQTSKNMSSDLVNHSRQSQGTVTTEQAVSPHTNFSFMALESRASPSPTPQEERVQVTLAHGCYFFVNVNYLPSSAIIEHAVPSNGTTCGCTDDSKAYIAAWLVNWVRFILEVPGSGWNRKPAQAQAEADKFITHWNLDGRVRDGLADDVVRAVQDIMRTLLLTIGGSKLARQLYWPEEDTPKTAITTSGFRRLMRSGSNKVKNHLRR
ncbi:hypothetical protein JX266_007776 [Neoarthrinium moseri]|nr:hypothetical protein JX266_007776 [Neoarthrinium moseri]